MNYIFEWLTADRQLIRQESFTYLIRLEAGYADAGRMASAGYCAGPRRFAAGAAKSV